MTHDSRLDDWLDLWDKIQGQPEPLPMDEFIRVHCDEAPPALIDEFKVRVKALASVDAILGAPARGVASTTGKSPLTARPGSVATPLKGGAELVPGFQLVSRVGKGGFGEVWKATAPGGVSVALKILQGIATKSELLALETMREVRHPHLISFFSAWLVGDGLVIAMELADRSLEHRLREVQAQGLPGIPREELLRYMEEAAQGLDFLHGPHASYPGKEGIQHRDIKPQNMLLQGGSIKIGDFGLARLMEHKLTVHSGSMTPAYGAPEFFRGKTSQHSDQYSLGITYCQLRGGKLPFTGSYLELPAKHLSEPPDLFMLPEGERAAVTRALHKDPEKRWPDCRAFAAALRMAIPGPFPVSSAIESSGVRQVWDLLPIGFRGGDQLERRRHRPEPSRGRADQPAFPRSRTR